MARHTPYWFTLIFSVTAAWQPLTTLAASSSPLLAPGVDQPGNVTRLDQLQVGAFVETFTGEVATFSDFDKPNLSRTPGLNENERAIAKSLDRVDERILERGFTYLKPTLAPVADYQRAFNAYLIAWSNAFRQFSFGFPFGPLKPLKFPSPPPVPKAAFNQLFNNKALYAAAYGRHDAGILQNALALTLPLNQALDRLSPEQLTVMPSIALSLANEQSQAVEERLAQIRNGVIPAGGSNSGKEMTTTERGSHQRWGTFVDGSGDFVDVDSTPEARGYGFTQGTATVGAYYRFSQSFTAGVMASYAGADASLANDNGRVTANSMEAALFATWSHQGFHVDVLGGGGYNSYDIRTHFGVEANGTSIEPLPVRAETDGGFGDWLLGAGYDFHAGRFVFGPTVSLEYTHVGIRSFSENAVDRQPTDLVSLYSGLTPKASARLINPVLDVMPQDVDSLKSTLGWAVSMPLNLGKSRLTPAVSIAWQHEYLDRQYAIDAAFPFAAGDPFTVHGPTLGSDFALLKTGATFQVNPRIALYASYDGIFARKNYSAHTVEGGARVSF